MKISLSRETRREAWTETKKAVRAYSKDPSKTNETQVRVACTYMRAVCGPLTPATRRDEINEKE